MFRRRRCRLYDFFGTHRHFGNLTCEWTVMSDVGRGRFPFGFWGILGHLPRLAPAGVSRAKKHRYHILPNQYIRRRQSQSRMEIYRRCSGSGFGPEALRPSLPSYKAKHTTPLHSTHNPEADRLLTSCFPNRVNQNANQIAILSPSSR